MKALRLKYLIVIIGIIFLGILSRKVNFIPLAVGDFLYATLIYFGLRFIFINHKKEVIAFVGLLFCFCIEASQLIKDWQWLNLIRSTQFGHYVLGEGFLWSDIVAYILGIAIAYLLDKR